MTQEVRDALATYLNLFPEVRWDRLTEYGGYRAFYGWIDRKDGKADFMLLGVEGDRVVRYLKSSKDYSQEFAERLGGTGLLVDHQDCQRVEDLGLSVNAITLTEAA